MDEGTAAKRLRAERVAILCSAVGAIALVRVLSLLLPSEAFAGVFMLMMLGFVLWIVVQVARGRFPRRPPPQDVKSQRVTRTYVLVSLVGVLAFAVVTRVLLPTEVLLAVSLVALLISAVAGIWSYSTTKTLARQGPDLEP
jgi:L-asparagine transporter-like permease